jgi:hypothetical protein
MDTWKERSASLLERVSPDGREALRRATAPIREGQRVEAAFEAASAWARENLPGGKTFESFYAACLCWLEAKGLYGGGPHCPGASTRRHPAFRGLGSGRRQANDGYVWTTAISSAAKMWLATFPDPHSLEWGTHDGEDLEVFLCRQGGGTVHSVTLPMLLGSEPEAMLNAALHAAYEIYPKADLWGELAPAIGKTIDLARELLANWK